MAPLEITKQYFEASNESDFFMIADLFMPNITYSSVTTGLYLWVDSIIEMQKKFHNSFESLEWKIQNIEEEKAWIVRVDFEFHWVKSGEKVEFSWIEYIIVIDWKIQHIEIRSK